MDFIEKIEQIIEPSLTDLGYEVVRIQVQGAKRKTLQVMIDNLNGQPVTVDNCAEASYTISALLEVEDPIADPYTLEVSSPGMDRPLVKLKDFERFAGEIIKFELKLPQNGQRRFQGLLKGAKQNKVLVELEEQETVSEFDYEDIQKAKIKPEYE